MAGINHPTVKASGQKLFAVSDWNADHIINAAVNWNNQDLTNIKDITVNHDLTVDTDTLFVDADNDRVGIGTTNPLVKLQIAGQDALYLTTPDFDTVGGRGSMLSFVFGAASGNTYAILQVLIDSWNDYGDLVLQKDGGKLGIGTASPTAKVDINSDILRLRTIKTPASAGAAGNQGDICWDANFIYVCVAANSWKRATIVAW